MKKLLSSGVIIALLSTNVITAYQYKKDINTLESEVKYLNYTNGQQESVIHKSTKAIIKQEKEIGELNSIILNKNNSIKTLKQQLEKAKKRNESPSKTLSRGKSEKKRVLNVVATGYVSYCDTGCIGKTRTGLDVSKSTKYKGMKIIAVDPNVIKLHSIVRVDTKEESFIAYAGDTGGDIVGKRIDILMGIHDTSKAFEFGKQNVQVTVLRDGKSE